MRRQEVSGVGRPGLPRTLDPKTTKPRREGGAFGAGRALAGKLGGKLGGGGPPHTVSAARFKVPVAVNANA